MGDLNFEPLPYKEDKHVNREFLVRLSDFDGHHITDQKGSIVGLAQLIVTYPKRKVLGNVIGFLAVLAVRILQLLDKNSELQSTITAQEDIIKRLREDAERLSQNHWYENEEDGKEYCNMCGFPFKKQFSEHDDDCPITLHTQLMNELGEK